MTGGRLTGNGPEGFLDASAEAARSVLAADEGWPTYHAGIAFEGVAINAMSLTAGEYLDEVAVEVHRIWGALTDEVDAPGRGSPEHLASAVRRMKRAAAEWLLVLDAPDQRAAYLDRWAYDECGYERRPSTEL